MPTIILKAPDNWAKTAAKKSFAGFQNKEGYQALAQGVSDTGDQLKEILVERQTLLNNIVMEEFKAEDKKFRESYIADRNAELAEKGLPPITSNLPEDDAERYKMAHANHFLPLYGNRLNGGAQRNFDSLIAQSAAVGAVDVKYAARQVENLQVEDDITKKVVVLLRENKIEAAKALMQPYLAKKIITQEYFDRMIASAPRVQQEDALSRLAKASPGDFLRFTEDPEGSAYDLMDKTVLARMRAQAQATVATEQTKLANDWFRMRSRAGGNPPDLDSAVKRGIISQTQADALRTGDKKTFFYEYWVRSGKHVEIFTKQEQAQLAAGDLAPMGKLADGSELFARVVNLDPNDKNLKQTIAQTRMLLAASDFSPSDVSLFENIAADRLKGDPHQGTNTLHFGEVSQMLADETVRASTSENAAKMSRRYLNGMSFLTDLARKNPYISKEELETKLREWFKGSEGIENKKSEGRKEIPETNN